MSNYKVKIMKGKFFFIIAPAIILLSSIALDQIFALHSNWWNKEKVLVSNPYEGVCWEEDIHFKAQFHTHTTASDGSWNPHQVVDMYYADGFRILAITDHDTHTGGTTWPWEAFERVEPSERSVSMLDHGEWQGSNSDLIRNLAGNLDFENRDPDVLGMLAVEGNEISRRGIRFRERNLSVHVLSLFSDWWSNEADITRQLDGLSDQKNTGLAVLAHPAHSWGRLWSATHMPDTEDELRVEVPDEIYDFYRSLFLKYPFLTTMEIANGTGSQQWLNMERDLALWDRLLGEFMPERPVWGLSVDDMHSIQFGFGWAILPLSTLDEVSTRKALQDGAYYFSYIHLPGELPVPDEIRKGVPVIEDIQHDPKGGYLTIKANVNGVPLNDQDCIWVGAEGRQVHSGLQIPYRKVSGIRNYIRAELKGPTGTTFTNPFGFDGGSAADLLEPQPYSQNCISPHQR